MSFTGHHFIWLTAWMLIPTSIYYFTGWKWLMLPWMPLSVIGTSVAFYLGFKNNQSYDRVWEARKIWGGIVNSSRMWAAIVQSAIGKTSGEEARELIYGYIGWIYTLRKQLLVPTQWEHVSGHGNFGRFNMKRRKRLEDQFAFDENSLLTKYLSHLPDSSKNGFSNQANYILSQQTKQLERLFDEGKLDRIKQYELQKIVNDCYEHQGKLERIKKFPLPRQYGSFSFIFVCVFVFLLPFGIINQVGNLASVPIWFAVPIGVIIGWIFVVMELIGDYSENPFEGLFNDMPMLSICRTIEIDALNILGKSHTLKPIEPIDGILM